MMKAQCHCRECQYITGGSPNVFVAMPVEGFAYTQGEPKGFTRPDLPRAVTREFCPDCGTHLATRPPGFPAVIVKVGTLDDPSQFGEPNGDLHIDKRAITRFPTACRASSACRDARTYGAAITC